MRYNEINPNSKLRSLLPPLTRSPSLSEGGFSLTPLYHKSAENARVIFRLRRSDIIATAIVILRPYGFSDILFALKLAKQISLGVSRISLRSNITRQGE